MPNNPTTAKRLKIESTEIKVRKTLDYWKLVEGDVMDVKRITYHNGEHHAEGTMNGKECTFPAVFFDIKYL
jgi:hypothetical protein